MAWTEGAVAGKGIGRNERARERPPGHMAYRPGRLRDLAVDRHLDERLEERPDGVFVDRPPGEQLSARDDRVEDPGAPRRETGVPAEVVDQDVRVDKDVSQRPGPTRSGPGPGGLGTRRTSPRAPPLGRPSAAPRGTGPRPRGSARPASSPHASRARRAW